MKPTGITSTSFRVWLATFIPGLAAAIQALVTNGSTLHTAVFGGGGVLAALFATLGKLWHDGKLNEATLYAAGSDIAKALPSLRDDLSKSVSFIENDVPAFKTLVGGLDGRVGALEAKVTAGLGGSTSVADIESVVRKVLTELLKPPTA